MSLLDQQRAEALIKLACQRFDPAITKAEIQILRDSASSVSPDTPDEDVPRSTIRPEFLRWLATDKDAALLIDPKGLRVYGYTIPGNLDLDGCHVAVTLDFRRCTIAGKIILQSAETKGLYLLDSVCEGGIRAFGLHMTGPLFLKGTSFNGAILLNGAKISGQVECKRAKLNVNEGEAALIADGAEIGSSVILGSQFESIGTVRLPGAKITGQLNCGGAKLNVKEGYALIVDNAEVGGNVFLDANFESTGTVSLLDAEIAGQLNCRGAKVRVKEGGDALRADNVEIGGDVFLDEQFESTGTIRLPGAKITGQLNCSNAKLTVKEDSDALIADYIEIGGSVFLHEHFESTGTIRFLGAKITGQLVFSQSKVANVVAENLYLSNDLFWTEMQVTDQTKLDLVGTKVKSIFDDEDSWPNEGNLALNGLVYEEIHSYKRQTSEEFTKARIAWLMRQPPEERLKPQPWMQLAKLLESRGDRKDAKHVIYRFRKLRAEQKIFNILKFVLGLILIPLRIAFFILTPWKSIPLAWPYLRHPNRSWSIAFAWLEEAPLRILYTITFSVLLGAHIFAGAEYNKAMIETVQTQPNAVQVDGKSGSITYKPVSAYYPKFQPFIYALENAIPLVKLGMDDKWTPNPQHNPQPLYPNIGWLKWLSFPNSYWFLMGTRWFLILTGWVQATIFVAAVADRFKK